MGNESLTNGHSHEMAGKATRVPEKILTTKPLENGLGDGGASYHDNYANYEADETTASLQESVIIVRRKFVNELDDVEDSSIESVVIENVLEFIERQRLIHMPHRGSHWDKVLKWAEFFALQVSRYAAAAEPFASESKAAAKLIWTASKSLLNLGPDNAMALEVAFGQFYRLGLSISSLLRDSTLLSASNEIRREVGQTLNIVLLLVRDVTFYYRLRLRSSAQETSFDFNGAFGGQIASFQKHKNHIVDAMWKQALGDGAATEYRVLRRWLNPYDEN
ncbi:hypothetical protein G7Y79_00036g072410 [Physcia stellaris]|nr:hypothetical protein G7Y79_00036g072410 [Physcia stellaris]